MVYADLDFLSGEVRLVQAGHPHPVLQRANGGIEAVGHGGLAGRRLCQCRIRGVVLTLQPGDRLFIALGRADRETEDPRGERPLGDAGLEAILRTNATLRGDALLESICWSAARITPRAARGRCLGSADRTPSRRQRRMGLSALPCHPCPCPRRICRRSAGAASAPQLPARLPKQARIPVRAAMPRSRTRGSQRASWPGSTVSHGAGSAAPAKPLHSFSAQKP